MKAIKRLNYWTLSAAIASSCLLNSAFAAEKDAEDFADSKAVAEKTSAVLKEISSPQSVIIGDAQKQLGGPVSILQKIQDKLTKVETVVINGKEVQMSWIETQLGKIRICVPVQASTHLSVLRAGVGFERCVEPTNIAGKQLLTDSYKIKVGAGNELFANTEMRVTFGRLIDGDKPKKEALTSNVYWLDKIPGSAQDVLMKMKVGETVRLEFSGNVGVGHFDGRTTDHTKTRLGASVKRGAMFLADFYRQTEKDLVTRFIGLNERATLEVGGSALVKLVGGVVGKLAGTSLVAVGPTLGVAGTDRTFGDHPIDTMMVVYRFNIGSGEAMDALDEIFTSIKTLKFIAIFNPFSQNRDIAQELLQQAQKAEALAALDRNLSKDQKRVSHEFRGRLTTHFWALRPGLLGFGGLIGSYKGSIGGQTTFVRKYNNENQIEYFKLDNFTTISEGKWLLGQFARKYRHETEMLVKSDANEGLGQAVDIVNRYEWQETHFDKSEMEEMKKRAANTLPAGMRVGDALNNFMPTSSQNSATFSYETSFGSEAFKAWAQMERSQLVQKMMEFLENHKERRQMQFPFDINSEAGGGLSEYADQLAADVYKITSDVAAPKANATAEEKAAYAAAKTASDKEKAEAFHRLKGNMIFQRWILGQFMPSLLPESSVDQAMRLDLKFSSDESGLKSMSLGQSKTSDIYSSVQFIRRILDDRSLNMHLDDLANSSGTK